VRHYRAGPGQWYGGYFGVFVNKPDPQSEAHDEVLKSFCTGNLQCLTTCSHGAWLQ
jgi:hypothetical protein